MHMRMRSHDQARRLRARRSRAPRGSLFLLPVLAFAWGLAAWVAPVLHDLEHLEAFAHAGVTTLGIGGIADTGNGNEAPVGGDGGSAFDATVPGPVTPEAASTGGASDGEHPDPLPFDHDHGDCLDCALLAMGSLPSAPALPPALPLAPEGMTPTGAPQAPEAQALPTPRTRGPPRA